MPSRFPGMDPYLEAPFRWEPFHNWLITSIAAQLNESLPDLFVASPGERLYVIQTERQILPDVSISQKAPGSEGPRRSGSVAVLDRGDEPRTAILEPEEFREPFVEILSLEEPRRVVTVIEVLSYSNKGGTAEGRELYLKKQFELLRSDVSLLEIDLLRRGKHTVAVPQSIAKRRDDYDYLVCLHRAGAGGEFKYWPIGLRQKLPNVWVPLGGENDDAILDLQAAFAHAYETGRYDRQIDYATDCPVPLSPEDAAWAVEILR